MSMLSRTKIYKRSHTSTLGGVSDTIWVQLSHRVSQTRLTIKLFGGVLIDLIVELLGLIIKPFDNQTES
jgi:hypothetical protein